MATVLSDPLEGEDALTALGLDFEASLAAGGTIRQAAERCGIALSTAYRWCRRFRTAAYQAPDSSGQDLRSR